MEILVHTDHTITGNKRRTAQIIEIVESALGRFSDHLTRLTVHLSDENSRKAGSEDIRCVIEAHMKGRNPIAITQNASVAEIAVKEAVDKLVRLIDHTLDRLSDLTRHPKS